MDTTALRYFPVEIAFALDCCDRECLAWVASSYTLTADDIRTLVAAAVRHRFGDARSARPIQWISDNGTIYTALETVIAVEQHGLASITTPVRSPESNGIRMRFITRSGATMQRAPISAVPRR